MNNYRVLKGLSKGQIGKLILPLEESQLQSAHLEILPNLTNSNSNKNNDAVNSEAIKNSNLNEPNIKKIPLKPLETDRMGLLEDEATPKNSRKSPRPLNTISEKTHDFEKENFSQLANSRKNSQNGNLTATNQSHTSPKSQVSNQKAQKATFNTFNHKKYHFNRRKTLKAQYNYFTDYNSLVKEFLLCGALCHECLIEKDEFNSEIKKFQGSSPDEIAICSGLKKVGSEFIGNKLGVSSVNFFDKVKKFQIKMSFEFDSARKRQSHVIFDGQNYKLLVKGADSAILSKLDSSLEHPYLQPTEDMLNNFSLLGYRTLVFATRYISKEEFQVLNQEYQEIANCLEGRMEKMSKFAEKVESNLVLLGMSAVEDSLQKNVKNTVHRLLGADIKVWMITGDKLETAHNIGLMAGIVNHNMEIFRLNFKSEGSQVGPVSQKQDFSGREMFTKEIERAMLQVKRVHNENEWREQNSIKAKKIAVIFDMRDVGKFKK